jgi:hypothetical protein
MGDLVRRTSLGASIERRAAAPLSDGGRAIEHAMWDVPAIAFDEFAQVSHPFGDHPVVDAVSDDGLVRRRRSDRAECYFRRRVGFRAWPSGIVVVAREQPRIGSTSAPSASSRSCRRRCGGASCSGHRARGGSRGHANQAVDACLRTFQYRLLLLFMDHRLPHSATQGDRRPIEHWLRPIRAAAGGVHGYSVGDRSPGRLRVCGRLARPLRGDCRTVAAPGSAEIDRGALIRRCRWRRKAAHRRDRRLPRRAARTENVRGGGAPCRRATADTVTPCRLPASADP